MVMVPVRVSGAAGSGPPGEAGGMSAPMGSVTDTESPSRAARVLPPLTRTAVADPSSHASA
jgi:hypothetical protein